MAPISFAIGFSIGGNHTHEPKDYLLSFFGHQVNCVNKNLTIDIFAENKGGSRFTKTEIERDEWVILLTGEESKPFQVAVFGTQLGGIEPGMQGYLTAYVGTYQNEFSELEIIEIRNSNGAVWKEAIYLGPKACFGNS